MTTGNDIFALAMALIDSLNEQTGEADTGDNADYKVRTPGILNVLRGELYPYSDTYRATDGGTRPISSVIASLDDEVDLDDYICQTVMPYGLAWHLLLAEDQVAANVYLQRYQELVARLTRGLPNKSEEIEDVYSSYYPHNNYSRW